MFTSFILVFESNHCPIDLQWKVTEERPEQALNGMSSTVSTFFPMVIVLKLVQPRKAFLPIVVTASGKSIERRFWQFQKAYSPMFVTGGFYNSLEITLLPHLKW